jgi:pentatricopeptide repeat protein
MMNSMCRLGFVENVVSCLSLFVKSGLEIDTVSVTTLLKGFAINNPSEGFQFAHFLSMKNIPVRMNEITVGTLIHCYCMYDLYGVRKARKIIKDIEEGVHEVIHANVIMYGTVIHGFCKIGRIGKAMKLYYRMLSRGSEVPKNQLP